MTRKVETMGKDEQRPRESPKIPLQTRKRASRKVQTLHEERSRKELSKRVNRRKSRNPLVRMERGITCSPEKGFEKGPHFPLWGGEKTLEKIAV